MKKKKIFYEILIFIFIVGLDATPVLGQREGGLPES